jgi:transposase
LLYEFGATFAKGRKALFKDVEQALEELSAQLLQMVRDSLREQVARIKALGADILTIEKRLGLQLRQDAQMQRIPSDPWSWSAHGDGGHCHHGRGQHVQVGLRVLRMAGLGAKANRQRRQGAIGGHLQTGDTYLRTFLIHGARSMLTHAKEPGPWLEQIK